MIIKQIKQIAAVWLLAAVAYGEPNIKLSIESETFYEGQGFEMQVTVLADQPPNDVIIGKSNDFYTQVLQEAIAESNGQRLYVYRYRLIPRKEGVADIPIVSMSIGETDYATESQLISVQTAQKTDKIRLEMNFARPGVAEVKVVDNGIAVGDSVIFTGNKTGALEQILGSMQVEYEAVESVEKGTVVAVKVDEAVRRNDKLYVIREVGEADSI